MPRQGRSTLQCSRTVAADPVRPAGLLNGVTPLSAAVGGGNDLELLTSDIGALVGAMAAAPDNVADENIVFVAVALSRR